MWRGVTELDSRPVDLVATRGRESPLESPLESQGQGQSRSQSLVRSDCTVRFNIKESAEDLFDTPKHRDSQDLHTLPRLVSPHDADGMHSPTQIDRLRDAKDAPSGWRPEFVVLGWRVDNSVAKGRESMFLSARDIVPYRDDGTIEDAVGVCKHAARLLGVAWTADVMCAYWRSEDHEDTGDEGPEVAVVPGRGSYEASRNVMVLTVSAPPEGVDAAKLAHGVNRTFLRNQAEGGELEHWTKSYRNYLFGLGGVVGLASAGAAAYRYKDELMEGATNAAAYVRGKFNGDENETVVNA